MTISELTDVCIWSPNTSGPRTAAISKVTVHHMAGDLTVETCGNVFASPSRQASSNYGVGSDGRIGCYLEEEMHPWTSSSYWNDDRAITIEVADYDCVNWIPSDAAYWATVKLCADICTRYGITPTYTGGTDGTFTEHLMYAATGCPGPWWHDHMPQFVDDVKSAMNGEIMGIEELLNRELATADSGNVPVWQLWSWGYTYAMRADAKCAELEKKVGELEKKVASIEVGGVDVQAVAKAVNDDAAARMRS